MPGAGDDAPKKMSTFDKLASLSGPKAAHHVTQAQKVLKLPGKTQPAQQGKVSNITGSDKIRVVTSSKRFKDGMTIDDYAKQVGGDYDKALRRIAREMKEGKIKIEDAAAKPTAPQQAPGAKTPEPAKPAPPKTDLQDPTKAVTFTKSMPDPEPLNGVAFKKWTPPTNDVDWAGVPGVNNNIGEPLGFKAPPGKKLATGVLIQEPDGRVWLAKPTNEFGGYKHTFPKGKYEPHLSLQENAIKEAYEETGLKVAITGYAGDFEGDTSLTRYYFAKRVDGTPKDHGWESEAVILAPKEKLGDFLNKQRDKDIASAHLQPMPKATPGTGVAPHETPKPIQTKTLAELSQIPGVAVVDKSTYAGKVATIPYPPTVTHLEDLKSYGPTKLATEDDAKASKDYWGIGWQQKQVVWEKVGGDAKPWEIGKPTVKADTQAHPGISYTQNLTKIGDKKGSNPGGTYQDADGNKFYVKFYANPDQGRSESLAGHVFNKMNARTPGAQVSTVNGETALVTPWNSDVQQVGREGLLKAAQDPKTARQLADMYHAAVLTKNHDVVGEAYDNIVVSKKTGNLFEIDTGGSFKFRAMGGAKPYGSDIAEYDSLMDPKYQAGQIFSAAKKAHPQAFEDSLKNIANMDMVAVKQHFDASGLKDSDELWANFQARRTALLKKLPQAEKVYVHETGKKMTQSEMDAKWGPDVAQKIIAKGYYKEIKPEEDLLLQGWNKIGKPLSNPNPPAAVHADVTINAKTASGQTLTGAHISGIDSVAGPAGRIVPLVKDLNDDAYIQLTGGPLAKNPYQKDTPEYKAFAIIQGGSTSQRVKLERWKNYYVLPGYVTNEQKQVALQKLMDDGHAVAYSKIKGDTLAKIEAAEQAQAIALKKQTLTPEKYAEELRWSKALNAGYGVSQTSTEGKALYRELLDKSGVETFSALQHGAVATYSGNGYSNFNAALRAAKGDQSKISSYHKGMASQLQTLMNKSRTKSDIILYRGINDGATEEGGVKFDINDAPPPPEFMDHAFTSMSLVPSRARGFAGTGQGKGFENGSYVPTLFKIRVPKGVPAFGIARSTVGTNVKNMVKDEAEILFAPGHRFRIVSRQKKKVASSDGGSYTVFETEVLLVRPDGTLYD